MSVPTPSSGRQERTIVITGAGGGLGRGISHRLLRDGFRCVLADLNGRLLEETITGAGSTGARATAVAGDIRLPEDRSRLIEAAEDQPGTLFGLVNNAGIGWLRPLLDERMEEWRATFETNLEAPFFLSQQVIERMRPHGQGRIVNIASMHGIVGLKNQGMGSRAPEVTPGDRGPARQSAYGASKGGLIQLTRDLAAAAGRFGIAVNAVSPGNVPHGRGRVMPESAAGTGKKGEPSVPRLGDPIDPDTADALARQTMLGRLGQVDEIAGPVSFLFSDDATYITGANLVVDGGFTSW